MNTETEVKLSKHLSAAVNAIQKEIDKKQKEVKKLADKATDAENQAATLRDEIDGLKEQQAKLKGE